MALSNYDGYAINEKGVYCAWNFKSEKTGVMPFLYKSWIYVQDEIGWNELSGFAKPVVMEIYSGALKYKDVNIFAVYNWDKSTIYSICWSGWKHLDTLKYTAMVGCYGYKNDTWIGVTSEMIKSLNKLILEFPFSVDDCWEIK